MLVNAVSSFVRQVVGFTLNHNIEADIQMSNSLQDLIRCYDIKGKIIVR